MLIYSPIGGYMNVSTSEASEMEKKGWFKEGAEGFVDRMAAKRAAQAKTSAPEQNVSFIESVLASEEKSSSQEQSAEEEYTIEYLREQWSEKYGKPADLRKGHRTLRMELGTWLQPKTE